MTTEQKTQQRLGFVVDFLYYLIILQGILVLIAVILFLLGKAGDLADYAGRKSVKTNSSEVVTRPFFYIDIASFRATNSFPNDTVLLQSAIDLCKAKQTVLFESNHTYYLTNSLFINGRGKILNGNGAILKLIGSTNYFFEFKP